MTKARLTQILTLALLAGALGIALVRNRTWTMLPPSEPTAEDAIYAMLDAARAGNAPGYLSHYTGSMRKTLDQVVAEQTEPNFAKYLKDTNASVKGVAVSAPEASTGETVKVRVEFVYADRNEAQMMYLRKEAGGWKIFQVDGSARAKTLVPYGTPVTE